MKPQHAAALAALAMAGATGLWAQTPPPPPVPPPAATPRPPELVKLEAQAATEIPSPAVPAGRAPEAKKVAEAAVAVQRATWVVEKLLPPPPEGIAVLKFADLKVGTSGWVDLTGEVVKVHEGVALVRPAIGAEGVTFAVPATTDLRSVTLRGEYVADRTVAIDGRDVIVLKEVAAAKAIDPAKGALLDAARKRLEAAKAEYARAAGVLRELRMKAEKAITQRAREQAAKDVVIPKDATVEEQVALRAKQQERALELAKAELEKVYLLYGEPLPGEPSTTPGTRRGDPGIPPPTGPIKPIGTNDPIKK
jgi:hypothetical protein